MLKIALDNLNKRKKWNFYSMMKINILNLIKHIIRTWIYMIREGRNGLTKVCIWVGYAF